MVRGMGTNESSRYSVREHITSGVPAPRNAPTEVGPGCFQAPGLYLWSQAAEAVAKYYLTPI